MPPQITSFEPHARPPDSFRKPRQGDLILFSQISSIRNEGRHERKPSFRQYSYLDVWGIFPGRAAAKEIPQAYVLIDGPHIGICEFAACGQQEAGVLLESPL
jgi:hypothetical protein